MLHANTTDHPNPPPGQVAHNKLLYTAKWPTTNYSIWPSGPQHITLYGQVAHYNMSQGTGPPQPLLNFGPVAHFTKIKI